MSSWTRASSGAWGSWVVSAVMVSATMVDVVWKSRVSAMSSSSGLTAESSRRVQLVAVCLMMSMPGSPSASCAMKLVTRMSLPVGRCRVVLLV